MLKKIPSILSPMLLKVISEMGHGDEIVIADGNFPTESIGKYSKVIRMDGHRCTDILKSILKLFPLDTAVEQPVCVMATDDESVPSIWRDYIQIMQREPTEKYVRGLEEIERYSFYERSKKAYAIVATGEKSLYANIILKKGTC